MPKTFATITRLIALGIQIVSPLLGVLVFNWNITEVVFLYAAEAAVATLYHLYKYGRTYKQWPDSHQKQFYIGSVVLRTFIEAVLVIGAFTVFVDSVLGERSTIFDDPQILAQYIGITFIPLLALCVHYLQAAIQLHKQPLAIKEITPLWIWIFQLPIPGLVYSYLLATQYAEWLVPLLVLITLCRAIVEWYHYTHTTPAPVFLPAAPNVLQSSPYSAGNILSQLFSYTLCMVGFFAVNPFTHDPDFTATQNVLIYLGCVVVLMPFIYRPHIRIQLNAEERTISIERGRVWKRYRTIVLADITRVHIQRNPQRIAHLCTFDIRGQKPWKCSNTQFELSEWRAWLRRLNNYSSLNIPQL